MNNRKRIILNEMALREKWQHFMTNNGFGAISEKSATTKQIAYKQSLKEPGIESMTSSTRVRCVTPRPPSKLCVSIVVSFSF